MLVGEPGFEPGTFCSQSRRATSLRYTPSARKLWTLPGFRKDAVARPLPSETVYILLSAATQSSRGPSCPMRRWIVVARPAI